jgi:hypothetical protein
MPLIPRAPLVPLVARLFTSRAAAMRLGRRLRAHRQEDELSSYVVLVRLPANQVLGAKNRITSHATR